MPREASVTSLLRSPSMEIINTGWAEAGTVTIKRANNSARIGHLIGTVRLAGPAEPCGAAESPVFLGERAALRRFWGAFP